MAMTPELPSYPPTLPMEVGETPHRSDVDFHARNLRGIALGKLDRYGMVEGEEDDKKSKVAYLMTNYPNEMFLWKITDTDISVDQNGRIVSIGDLFRGLIVEGITWQVNPSGENSPVKKVNFELPRRFPLGPSKARELVEDYDTDDLFEASCDLYQAIKIEGASYEAAVNLMAHSS